jgi:hypothetical protein
MNFKIAKDRTLCMDLSESKSEEIVLVLSTLASVCDLLEQAGHRITIRVKEEKQVITNKVYAE